MNIEKVLDVCYKVFLSAREQHRLEIIAHTFYHDNTTAAMAEIITDGIMIAESVKDMLEDTEHQNDITQRFCESQLDRVHRRWKDKKDASDSKNGK